MLCLSYAVRSHGAALPNLRAAFTTYAPGVTEETRKMYHAAFKDEYQLLNWSNSQLKYSSKIDLKKNTIISLCDTDFVIAELLSL